MLPQPYTVTNAWERLMLYDNNREDRLLLFGTDRSIDHLAQCNLWFMDGTFKTSPLQFTQLYSIPGSLEGRNIACAYALLPDKRANTYIELLRQLQQLPNNVIPADINIDFERGMIGAIRQVYPLCPIYGCLFHLSKNVYKHVQELGLQQMYQEDELFRENIRMIHSLSFVPVQDTVAAFDRLTQH